MSTPEIKNLRLGHRPGYRFEWHVASQKVYVVKEAVPGRAAEVADPIAYNIENHGAAINAALIWSRGYKYRDELEALTLIGGLVHT